MTGSGLAAAVKSAVAAIPAANRDHDTVWNAIGDAIVTFIQANAVVTVASVSGVTTGPGVSGPGTGTIS
jgi:hypothetical protein